jgi:MFS transporter, PAT family, beta-lactamase induction signal transducer AmpG
MSRPSTWQSFNAAIRNWRLGSVILMSFPSGVPLGFVWTAVPAWLTLAGVDIKTVGFLTLAQAPYGFKFLWSPLFDRFRPPFLGKSRGWILVWQVVLSALYGLLVSQAVNPNIGIVAALTLLIAFASASQDIAVDAYAVEVLEPDEMGKAVGGRTATYRVGMYLFGKLAVTLGPVVGWGWTIGVQAAVFLLFLPVTIFAPEPPEIARPPTSLRAAVWEPFVAFFKKPMALEIVGFLILYKLADNLAQALTTPFLLQVGFTPLDVGVLAGVIGMGATIFGTIIGGIATDRMGVGRALWFFGFVQAISNVGYAIVAQVGVNRVLMFAATFVETATSGMGAGAFGVLLLRLTEKRFSATQYALFSSIFGLGRVFAGPVSGILVDAIGWREFFLFSIPCAIPGMVMLQRFVPWGSREVPQASLEATGNEQPTQPLTPGALGIRAFFAIALGSVFAAIASAFLSALKVMRGGKPFDFVTQLTPYLSPTKTSHYVDLFAAFVFGVVIALAMAAYLAARRGIRRG